MTIKELLDPHNLTTLVANLLVASKRVARSAHHGARSRAALKRRDLCEKSLDLSLEIGDRVCLRRSSESERDAERQSDSRKHSRNILCC
jgi:hypothetical protein